MFGWFSKDPLQRLELEYAKKLEEARDIQRVGDMVGYSRVMAEAEEILLKINEAGCDCAGD